MKFRVKMTLCMLCLMSLVFGVGGSLLLSLSFRGSLERETESAYRTYQTVLSTLQVVNQTQAGYGDIAETLGQLAAQRSSVWAALRLTDGSETLYQSGSAAARFQDMSGRIEPSYCLIAHMQDEDGGRYLQLSGAFAADDKTMVLDLAHDISSVYAARDVQQSAYQKVFLVMLVLCAVLSYSISWILTRPLSRLSNASREIASGNLAYRARIRSHDEVGALASDFNHMARTLEANVSELTAAMERQERFMGSFAHEMKTPMTSIIGYADLIRSQALAPEEQADAANYVFSEGKRLESLSRKLLDILVLGQTEVALTLSSPRQIIVNLVEHLRPVYLERGIRLQQRCEEGACLLEPDLFKSLLVNLLDNARKALDQGGNIVVVCEMLPDGCRVRVLDNGRGIPEEALGHLTEAFYRVDKSRARAQGGAGLGLTLCSEIAALHGGTIGVDSRVGNGTCVTVELRGGRA